MPDCGDVGGIKKPPRGGEGKYDKMKKMHQRLGGWIVSLWDGLRFAFILWKEGKTNENDGL